MPTLVQRGPVGATGPGPQSGVQTGNSLLFGPQVPGQFSAFDPMFDPTMMMMLLEGFTRGQEMPGAPKGRPGDGARMQQAYPQATNNAGTRETRSGVTTSGSDAVWGEEEEHAHSAPYQSTGFSIPDRGAAKRYPAFQDVKNLARERGAKDDSVIGPHSSPWEDEANLGRVDTMAHLAGRDLAEAVLQASPEQREQISDGEARLEAKLREEEDMGNPVPLSRQRMMYAQNIEDLHQQGMVGPEIGQRNREYMQLLETRDRSAIDMGLKYGYGPPVGADPAHIQESAFHPRGGAPGSHGSHGPNGSHRPNPGQRAETRPRPSESQAGSAVTEIKLDEWGKGPASSTWGALRKAGWTDREIIDRKLVDQVAQMNGLEDPARVSAGATLKVPARGGEGDTGQKGALYQADGGPAHRTPGWQKPAAPQKPQETAQPSAQRPAENAPERKAPPYDPSKDATALYESMHGGMGIGTDEDKLFKALEGKTEDQVKAIRAHYKDHYNRDIDKDLTSELGGKELSRAQALMTGETGRAAADADKLQHAMKGGLLGWGVDKKAVYETLEGKTKEQREAIIAEYSKRNNGADLRKELEGELDRGPDRDRGTALLEGKQAAADAAAMRSAIDSGFLGMGKDKEALYKTLEGKDEKQRAEILREYRANYGGDDAKAAQGDDLLVAKRDIEGFLGQGAELDRANALLAGDQGAADAAALNTAVKGGVFGPDKDKIYQMFEGKSQDERRAIVEKYGKYGNLDSHLTEELDGNNLEKAQKLVADGKLSDVDRMRYAIEGAGTDEGEIKAVLAGKSRDEIKTLREEYSNSTGRNLDTDLESDLSGRDLFDAQMDLKGRPESAEEAVQRQNERWEYERGEGNTASNFFVDLFSEKGQLLDRNTQRMNEQFDRVGQLRAEGRMQEAQEAEQRLSQLVDYTQDDVRALRETKDSAANAAGTVAATAASVAVVVGTAGTATPLVVAGMAAAAGAGAKVATAGAIQGRGYGWEDGLTDAGTGAVDGLATAVGAKAGQVVANQVGKSMAARAAAKAATVADDGARTMTAGANLVDDGVNVSRGVAASGGTQAATTGTTQAATTGTTQAAATGTTQAAATGTTQAAATGTTQAAATGTTQAAATGTTQAAATGTTQAAATGTTQAAATGTGQAATAGSRTLGQKVAMGAAEGAVDGTVGGAAGGAGQTALSDGTWDQGLATGLGRVAQGTAIGAGTGLVAGGVVGGAIPLAGKAISDAREATGNAASWTRGKVNQANDALQAGAGKIRQAGEDMVGRIRGTADNAAASEAQLFDLVTRQPDDFQRAVKDGLGKLAADGKRTPTGRAHVIMSESNQRMIALEEKIHTPLGPGTREQNEAVARVLNRPDLADKDGLVQNVIRARAQAVQDNLVAQGKDPAHFKVYRQEALGTFDDMERQGIALTPDQEALRASIKQYNDYESIFGAAQNSIPKPGVLDRVRQAGRDFYDYGMEGGYLGHKLKKPGAVDNVADDAAAGGPKPKPKPEVEAVVPPKPVPARDTLGDDEFFEVVSRQPEDFQRVVKSELGKLQQSGQFTPDAPARVVRAEANQRMIGLEEKISTPLGPGTREQNEAVARILNQPELAGQDGLVQNVIRARAQAVQSNLKAQGQDPSYFRVYRQEALGTFDDMEKHGIALTADQQALRVNIKQYDDYENIFQAAQKNLAGHADDAAPTPAPAPKQPDVPAPRPEDVGPAPAPRAPDAPTPPSPDAPTPPSPDAPTPPKGPLDRFWDLGMSGGLIGRWAKNNDLSGGGLISQGKDLINNLNDKAKNLLDGMGLNLDNFGDDAGRLADDAADAGKIRPRPVDETPGGAPRAPAADEVAAGFRKRVEQFPDQGMLSRFRQETSFSQLDPQQQHTVLELAMRHKPEQPTGMLARLFGAGDQQTSAMEGHLQKLMRDGRLTNTDPNGVTLLDNLNQLDTAPKMYHRSMNARALSEEVAATVANPAAVIKQGRRGTCSATSVQYIHAYKNPSDYARVMRELATQGEATLASGKTMAFNRSAIPVDDSGRRITDRYYQASAMNHASGRYDNNIANPDMGTGGHVKPDGSYDYDGLTNRQGGELLDDVMGYRHGYADFAPGSDTPELRQAFQARLEQLQARGEPMHAGMIWGDQQHRGHAVVVESMDDRYVYIRNPHGADASTNNSHTSGSVLRENLSRQGDGRQRIALDEFFSRVDGYGYAPRQLNAVENAHFQSLGDSYGALVTPDAYGDPAALAAFKARFPDAQIDQLSESAQESFFRKFNGHVYRAGKEAAPMGTGNYREVLAELDEYMKQHGYPDGDFTARSYNIA